MADTDDKGGARAQVVVSDGLAGDAFRARVGTSEFAVGGQIGADPYELLSVSLAACTAMTLRFHALRRKYSLSHLEVAVSYHHGVDGGRDVFERVITLQGELDETQRAQLLQDANKSPVTRTLSVSADIRTRYSISDEYTSGSPASYETDLRELSIPNIDPD
jgi:putative redox protein